MFDGLQLHRLGEALDALAPDVVWPATPDVRSRVRARIDRRRRWKPVILLLAAALALVIGSSAAIAGYLALRGATVQVVQTLPSPSPQPPGSVGTRYELGQRYASIGEAGRVAGFRPLAPNGLGTPDLVYWRADPGVITLVYRPRPGLPAVREDPEIGALVMEARGSVDQASFGKLVAVQGQVKAVAVNGAQGFWVTGAQHGFFFYQHGAGGQGDNFRLSGDALVWNQSGLVVRIESGLTEDRALQMAGTVHAAAV